MAATISAVVGCGRGKPRTDVTSRAQPLVQGLVAAYGFEEGAGGTTADASGNGLTGTISGAAWARGKFGNALRFDGVGDWVTVADAAALHLSTGMTLSAWVKPTREMQQWPCVVLKETTGDLTYTLYASSDADQPSGWILSDGDENGVNGDDEVPLHTWTHLATTYDGSTLSMYVNGALVATESAPASIDPSTGVLRIGGNGVWNTEYFFGLIDEVRVYNRPLSAAEIATDMNTALAPAGPSLPITVGEPTLLPINDQNNQDLLIAQKAYLAEAGSLQSLSFYVANAVGKLRLGIYDSTGANGRPGHKLAESAEITPTVGWNTVSVAPVSLPAGIYWLAHAPSAQTQQSRRDQSGEFVAYDLTYGPLPAALSVPSDSGAIHWSFYATLVPLTDTFGARIRHAGSVDPTTEDGYVSQGGTQLWTRSAAGTPVAHGLMDGDVAAWEVNTTGDTSHEEVWTVTPSAADVTQGARDGWTLSTRLRLPTTSDIPGHGVTVEYSDGFRAWQMRFGTDGDGDPIVMVGGDTNSPTFTLEDVGNGGYHTYALRSDPATNTAILLVDGVVRIRDLLGWSQPDPPSGYGLGFTRVGFGDWALSDHGHGRFASVEWAVADPPAPFCAGKANGTACEDGFACSTGDTCQSGACVGGTPAACGAVTFYEPYESSAGVATIARGAHTISEPGVIQQRPGPFGYAETTKTEQLRWTKASNVTLAQPGSLSFWVRPIDWHQSRMLAIVLDWENNLRSVIENYEGGMYANLENSATNQVASVWLQGSTTNWAKDSSWHLVVVNWDASSISLSLDGAAPTTSTVPWSPPASIPGGGGYLYAAGMGNIYNGFALLDEMLVLNRKMTSAEMGWVWSTRLAPRVPNPAVTYFSGAPPDGAPCDDGNACTTGDVRQNGQCVAGTVTCVVEKTDRCEAAPSGLVTLWSAEGNGFDSIGSRNEVGTTGVRYGVGRFGGQSFMTGTGDPVPTFAGGAALPTYTVDLWFQRFGSFEGPLLNKSNYFALLIDSGHFCATLGSASNPTGRLCGPARSWQTNHWYHGAATYDGTTVRLYVDGQLETQGASAASLFSDGTPFNISGAYGAVDEFGLYNRALSAAEVAGRAAATARICARTSCGGVAEGAACHDGNVCTYGDRCRADGTCSGAPSVACEQERAAPPPVSGVPTGGLLAWWSGEDNANDLVGAHHGELQNGGGYVTGKRGRAFHFDNVDDQLVVTGQSITLPRFTLSLWLKPDATIDASDPNAKIFVDKGARTIGIANGDGRLELGSTPRAYSYTNAWPAGVWRHVAITYDGVVYGIYVNGILESWTGATPSMLGDAQGTLRLGRWWPGAMDEIGVYDRALASTEVAALASEGQPPPASTPCDDGNPCTDSDLLWNGVCAGVPVQNGTSCSDLNACTTGDVCTAGVCAGTPVVCEGGDTCNPQVCQPATGICQAANAPAGTPCHGGPQGCANGTCQQGTCNLTTPDVCHVVREEGACHDTIVNQLSAAEAMSMLTSFSWASSPELSPTDLIGRQAVYYALIYVEDREQLEGLDDLRIHHSSMPLFVDPGLNQGKCGTMTAVGDGEGAFVYAVIPGTIYNQIRWFALNPDPVEGDRTLYRMIKILPPPGMTGNAVGALSYEFLQQSGFRYRDLDTFPPLEGSQAPFWNALKKRLVNYIRDATRWAVEHVVDILGAIDRFPFGSATITFDMHIMNRDPAFDPNQPMIRAWGAQAGQELRLRDVNVSFYYVSPATYFVTGGLIPVIPHRARTDSMGRAVVKVPKHLPLFGATVEKETEAARIYTSLVTDTHTIVGLDDDLTNIGGDRHIDYHITDDAQLHALNQFTDGYDFIVAMTGNRPNRAEVFTGPLTVPLAPNGRAYTPCFGFPHLDHEVTQGLVNQFFGPLGHVVAQLTTADIVLPSPHADDALNSRVVATHEYGHYALCTMLWQKSREDSQFPWQNAMIALSRITLDYVLHGIVDPFVDLPDFPSMVLYEGFADFFTGQVAGAVNYRRKDAMGFAIPPNGAVYSPGPGFLCTAPPCLEENETDVSGDFESRINWATSLFHDAFDGHDSMTPVPGDADGWTGVAPLQASPTRYADSCGKTPLPTPALPAPPPRSEATCDERVSLMGPHLRDWVGHWLSRGTVLSYTNFVGGLVDTMQDAGVDWCRRCELFAAHTTGLPGGPNLSLLPGAGGMRPPPRHYWDMCTAPTPPGSTIARWIGPPPDPHLALNGPDCTPCLPHHFSPLPADPAALPTGACVPCTFPGTNTVDPNAIAVRNTCQTCANGSTRAAAENRCQCLVHQRNNADLNCENCPGANDIATDPMTCTACNFGSMRIATENRCACPARHVNTSDGLCRPCGSNEIRIGPMTCGACTPGTPAANDTCLCPAHYFNLPSGLCEHCGQGMIFNTTTGMCQACPPDEVPQKDSNTCGPLDTGCGPDEWCGGSNVRDCNNGVCDCIPRSTCLSEGGSIDETCGGQCVRSSGPSDP
jgi:hypothetical protein